MYFRSMGTLGPYPINGKEVVGRTMLVLTQKCYLLFVRCPIKAHLHDDKNAAFLC